VVRRLIGEGAFVFGVDRNRDRLESLSAELNATKRTMQAVTVDIADGAAVEGAIQRIEAERPIDLLVNAAGVLYGAAFEATTPELWLATFAVNAHGTFFVSRAVTRRMAARRVGAVVTVASNAGSTPRVGMSAYCASKAAAAMLTRCMGLELARSGVRCNVVSPGSTDTPMLRAIAEGPEERTRLLIEGDLGRHRLGIPLGRIASPDDIAAGVAFLLSEEAKHVTMHELLIDGGATLG
jgi:2,3-dihydro-2,3-dihydroxybenzoate dehydrogenase